MHCKRRRNYGWDAADCTRTCRVHYRTSRDQFDACADSQSDTGTATPFAASADSQSDARADIQPDVYTGTRSDACPDSQSTSAAPPARRLRRLQDRRLRRLPTPRQRRLRLRPQPRLQS